MDVIPIDKNKNIQRKHCTKAFNIPVQHSVQHLVHHFWPGQQQFDSLESSHESHSHLHSQSSGLQTATT
ncbi:14231_t:CDS:1, partial [Gigaspora margarita]